MQTLQPVLTVIPPDARATNKIIAAPNWDSCDGAKSSYGWNYATVDEDFLTAAPQSIVQDDVRHGMKSLGWDQYPPGTPNLDGLEWHRTVPGGGTAVASLTYGTGGNGPTWRIHAEAPPATHPITGC
jgi:hypothetical protein